MQIEQSDPPVLLLHQWLLQKLPCPARCNAPFRCGLGWVWISSHGKFPNWSRHRIVPAHHTFPPSIETSRRDRDQLLLRLATEQFATCRVPTIRARDDVSVCRTTHRWDRILEHRYTYRRRPTPDRTDRLPNDAGSLARPYH